MDADISQILFNWIIFQVSVTAENLESFIHNLKKYDIATNINLLNKIIDYHPV